MESEDENFVYIKENPEIEYVKDTPYIRQMLDIPEVEIAEDSVVDEVNENEYNQTAIIVEGENNIKTNESDEAEETWDESKVKKLLNMYLENVDKFRNPKVRKKNLWKKIGAIIGKDADACDKKYRNLKQHYVTLLRKKKHFGKNHIRWPFFNLFEQIGSKCGFNLNNTVKYRPIAMKPQWGSPQYVVVSNAAVKNPMVVNAPVPVNNNVGSISICDLPELGPQKKRILEEFQSVSEELRNRQNNIELKLDRLVELVRESNNIQRERNRLFQDYLKRINK